jgi:hypothetical protein
MLRVVNAHSVVSAMDIGGRLIAMHIGGVPLPSTAPSPLTMSPWVLPPTATAPSPCAVVLSPKVISPMSKLTL